MKLCPKKKSLTQLRPCPFSKFSELIKMMEDKFGVSAAAAAVAVAAPAAGAAAPAEEKD